MFKLIIIIISLLSLQSAFSKSQIKDVFFQVDNYGKFNMTIISDGEISRDLNTSIKDNLFQVEIPQSIVWPKINKELKVGGDDIQILAYQYNKNIVRVRAIYPNGKNLNLSNTNITYKKNNVMVAGVLNAGTVVADNAAKYDESYLNKLIQEKETIKNKIESDKRNLDEKVNNIVKQDSVNLKYSSPLKEIKHKNGFNVWNYAFKFFALLCLMIGLIYGVFIFLKKGALKKSKISFLNPDRQIEVVSRHALSPKRSLNLIRVNKQVFLIASHENGIEFLSEIDKPGDVLRDAEKEFTGDNFSENLNLIERKNEISFPIKEDINISTPVEDENSIANKVKNKIKRFKDIQ